MSSGQEDTMKRVTGIGGILFKAADQKSQAEWEGNRIELWEPAPEN
jgi:hypothetical protein